MCLVRFELIIRELPITTPDASIGRLVAHALWRHSGRVLKLQKPPGSNLSQRDRHPPPKSGTSSDGGILLSLSLARFHMTLHPKFLARILQGNTSGLLDNDQSSLHLRHSSFSNPSVAELILQPFRHFTYVTAHSPTLSSLYLRHSSFSNPSFAYPTSQALHLIHVASRKSICKIIIYCCYYTSPGSCAKFPSCWQVAHSTLAVSVPINLSIKLNFVFVNGPRETYFVYTQLHKRLPEVNKQKFTHPQATSRGSDRRGSGRGRVCHWCK